jgi:hypothetical protein
MNCVNSTIDYNNTSAKCIDCFVDYANKFDDCAKTLDDWANIVVQSILLTNHLQNSRCQIPHFYSYCSWICYTCINWKSILCSLQDLWSVHHLLYSAFVFHSLHFPPPCLNFLPKLHLHYTPNLLASIVLVDELQIPCTYKV